MPQQPENPFKPEEILRIILKRRWFIIVPFCLALIAGIYLSITLPKKYEASTLIMIQAQRVPDSYVQSVVSSDIAFRLNTITQQVMSRTNIERLIEEYDLFTGPKYEDMFPEDKVAIVRNNIGVKTDTSGKRNELSTFSISYKGETPEKVRDIANALATYFIDQNLKVREAQAVGTSDFLDSELTTMRQRLEQSEQAYREYRQKFMGELPEQLDANLNILGRLNEETLENQKAVRELVSAITELEHQIAESKETARAAMMASGGMEDGESADIEQLRMQLESLRTKYTENHPSVVRLKNMIEKLSQSASPDTSEGSDTATPSGITSPQLTSQEKHLADLKSQVRNLEENIEELKKKTTLYQARVENTPKREEELLGIERDYDNLKAIYDSLLNRRLEAEISVNMEKKQKGEQFQIIDPARAPEKPIEPDMKRLFLLTVAIGLGIGGGLVYLLEFMKRSFKSIHEVESYLELPVLATVPSLLYPKDRAMKRLNDIFSIASLAISLFLLTIFSIITLKGADAMLAVIKRVL